MCVREGLGGGTEFQSMNSSLHVSTHYTFRKRVIGTARRRRARAPRPTLTAVPRGLPRDVHEMAVRKQIVPPHAEHTSHRKPRPLALRSCMGMGCANAGLPVVRHAWNGAPRQRDTCTSTSPARAGPSHGVPHAVAAGIRVYTMPLRSEFYTARLPTRLVDWYTGYIGASVVQRYGSE